MASTRITLRALVPVRVPVRVSSRPVRWRVVGSDDHPFVRHLRAASPGVDGPTVDVVALGTSLSDEALPTLLAAMSAGPGARHVVLVHSGAGGGTLLRGLAAEQSKTVATVIELADPTPAALATATGLLGAPPYAVDDLAVHGDGTVTTDGWRPIPLPAGAPDLAGQAVVVTGGLGGLGIRVAVALAAAGAVPVVVDVRAEAEAPIDTQRYVSMLRRLAPEAQVVQVDLTDREAARRCLAGLAPRALVHCAGRVVGGTGRKLTVEEISAMGAAKVGTLQSVLSAVDHRHLRAVLAFGSVTARGAHPGLYGYALANESLRREMGRLAAAHPAVRWCTAEWSLWSGAGIARGVRAAARLMGMVPIPVTTGVAATVELLGALTAAETNGGAPVPGSLVIAAEVRGAEGRWSGRPEGIPGIDTAYVVQPGANFDQARLDKLARIVAAAAVPDAALDRLTAAREARPAGTASPAGAPLLLRAAVAGDRVDCVVLSGVSPGPLPAAEPILRYQYQIRRTRPVFE